jgi:hypothetical protein
MSYYIDFSGKPPHALNTLPVILPSAASTYNLAVSTAVTNPSASCPGSTIGAGLDLPHLEGPPLV